eukprot:TRINITY_DN3663_c0_g1_i1.p1 TRINITY_DN3663_c0_g1~~TRINITY_DN3663_c0_g1_i1.p1  ORF type:complete len:264 (-),score=65.89 TRINITY_DN3663_c0_g1_i1:45-836(-)
MSTTAKSFSLHPGLDLVDIPNKGKGYTVNKPIEIGEVLIEEDPIIKSKSNKIIDIAEELIFDNPEAFKEIYCPKEYPIVPTGFEEISDQDYSRACAQIQANIFSNNEYFLLNYRTSFINHSCRPNACFYLDQNMRVKIYAVEKIEPGQEITLCYKQQILVQPLEMRKQWLKTNWFFDCTCVKCTEEQQNSKAAKKIAEGWKDYEARKEDLTSLLAEDELFEAAKVVMDIMDYEHNVCPLYHNFKLVNYQLLLGLLKQIKKDEK